MTATALPPAASMIRTRITSLLKCQYPVILPGMSWISTPELVAAVSQAGGVGILATGPLSADETRASIRRVRQLTDKPFGIGATLLMPGAEANARVALDEQVPLINVSLGKADWVAEGVHRYGGTLLSTVTNAKHAAAAIAAGADALMVTGHEAAAHGGEVTSLVLVPCLAERFPETPIVAAGGFANGKGLAAALALGADAIAMGSRFAVSQESPLAESTKQVICQSTESDTIYGKNFDGIHARVLTTPLATKLMKRPPSLPTIVYRAVQAARQMNMPMWQILPGLVAQFDKMFMIAQFGAATAALQTATVDGNVDQGVQFIGQGQGMIHSIDSVQDIMQRVVHEAHRVTLQQAARFEEDWDRQGSH